jgi:hypothetical protein
VKKLSSTIKQQTIFELQKISKKQIFKISKPLFMNFHFTIYIYIFICIDNMAPLGDGTKPLFYDVVGRSASFAWRQLIPESTVGAATAMASSTFAVKIVAAKIEAVGFVAAEFAAAEFVPADFVAA